MSFVSAASDNVEDGLSVIGRHQHYHQQQIKQQQQQQQQQQQPQQQQQQQQYTYYDSGNSTSHSPDETLTLNGQRPTNTMLLNNAGRMNE